MLSKKRPCFFYKENKYVSGGVIIYTIKDKINYYLLQNITGKMNLEDFGGCSDSVDKSIKDVAFRECVEESNGLLTRKFLNQNLDNDLSKIYYIDSCKYVLYLIYVDPKYLEKLSPKSFGNKEIHDNIKRTVNWYPRNGFNYNNIHIRLCSILDDLK